MFLQIIQQKQDGEMGNIDHDIEAILQQYSRFFKEPKELPPKSRDHQINLKEQFQYL